jgi:hypothetical protein
VNNRPLFSLLLRPLPGLRVPQPVALRQLLKALGRQHGLDVLEVRELDVPRAAPPPPGDQHAYIGWRRLRGGTWKAVAHGPSEEFVRELLRQDAPLVCVRPAGVHPDDKPPAHQADGGADAGDR